MIRATRIPLGLAARMTVKVGGKDIDGDEVKEGEEGWYFKWWRGLYCLMGDEGYKKGMCLVRPSFESFRCEGWTFKKAFKAVIQAEEGEEE